LYVQPFQPVAKGSSGFGPLHAITSGLHAHRVDENAAGLSRVVVASLLKAHIAAQGLPLNAPLPQTGPNVEVTVTLADIAKNPDRPFAIIGTDSVLKGEGAPIGWNPYVVSARAVAHRIEGDKSFDLADQIAQKIAERSADLISRNAVPP
jgi:hypothetical protein